MTTPNQDLTTLLQQQQAQLDALLSLLNHELTALSQREVEQLDALTQQKDALLTTIQQTDQAINQLPSLASYQETDWFKQAVQQLNTLLAQCKHQTAVNQQVLEQSQLTLDRLKHEILSVKGKSGLTYTNKGKPAVEHKSSGIKA